ncbi:MAG: hypothetical protein V7603_6019 [Micromonosporaceae bacterium]
MAGVRDETDDELVDRLSRIAAEADPVPQTVRLAARAAFSTRDLDGELAALVGDSAMDAESGLAFEPVRGGSGGPVAASRMLSFAGGGVQVDLEISRYGARVDVIGQFAGAEPGGCALEYVGREPRTLDLDDLGRFLVSGADPGTVRLRCTSAAGTPVVTSWITT